MPYSSRLELVIDSRSGERSLKRVERGLADVDRAGDRAAGSLSGVTAETSRLRGVALAASGALAGLVGAAGAGEVIRYADAWANTANQIRQVTSSSDELAKTQRELLQIANDSRSAYESTVDLYTRLEKSTQELGISSERLLGITDSINKSFALSGATAEESAGAITQLAQGLAAGALRGDEFNSVAEQAPEIMRAIADSLGMTIGELRDFAAEGGITAQVIIDAMEGAAASIDQAFGQSIATFGQKMAVSRNNILEWVGASDELNDAVGLAGDAIVGLSGNIDTLVDGAQFLAVLMAGRLSGSLATATAAKLAATRQTIAYQAALARMAGVSGTAATAQLAMGAAVRTASAAMAVVGGPVGVAVLAAGAIYAYRDELSQLPGPAMRATQALDGLTDALNDNSEAAIKNRLAEIATKMSELETQATSARQELERINEVSTDPGPFRQSAVMGVDAPARAEAYGQLNEAAEQLDVLTITAERLEGQLDQLGTSERALTDNTRDLASVAAGAASDVSQLSDDADELADSLQRLHDRLFPVEALQRQYREEQALLTQAWNQGIITADRYAEAMRRLEQAQLQQQSPGQAYGSGSGAAGGLPGGFISQVGPREGGVDQDQTGWERWLESAQTAFTDFDAMAANTAENFQRGFGQAFESMIFDSQSFGDSMYSLFDGIARTLVQSLGEMAAQWVAYQAVQLALGQTTQATTAATAAATGASIAAAYAPAATMASLASFGANAAPAMAGIASTSALSQSLASATNFAGLFDNGGNIPTGKWGIAGEYGPEIIEGPARVTSRKQTAEMLGQQSQGNHTTVNVIEDASRAGQVNERQDTDGKAIIDVVVANITGDGQIHKAMSGKYALSTKGR
ncbi:tape measure protein [Halomonas litopenaei]|uniref:tape measure protein n=1 Tax=Halomonas litopenaei TaxID=2109328 RepID=UPI003FA0C25F